MLHGFDSQTFSFHTVVDLQFIYFFSEGLAGNMNGRYLVASGGNQGVAFNDDYASKGHEYFDVYSPEIATHYGEVFWTDQGNNPLPKEIIQRFDGESYIANVGPILRKRKRRKKKKTAKPNKP